MNTADVKGVVEGLNRMVENERRKGLPDENSSVFSIREDWRKMVKDGFRRLKVFKED